MLLIFFRLLSVRSAPRSNLCRRVAEYRCSCRISRCRFSIRCGRAPTIAMSSSLQIVERRLRIFHRQFRQRLMQETRDFVNRGADGAGGIRTARDRAERKIGFAELERDVLEWHAELFRRNLRERGVSAGAEIVRRALHRRSAVRAQVAPWPPRSSCAQDKSRSPCPSRRADRRRASSAAPDCASTSRTFPRRVDTLPSNVSR